MKQCPRCNGQLIKSRYEPEPKCLQCSYVVPDKLKALIFKLKGRGRKVGEIKR